MNNHFVFFEYPSVSLNVQFTTNGMCAKTSTKGCSANKRGVGRHPKKLAVLKQLQTCFNAKREKGGERRSHAFPLHYTPAYTHIYVARTIEDLHPYICKVCEFLETNYCIPKRWPMGPLQQSLAPLAQTSSYATVYCRSLAAHTDLGFCTGIMHRSF